MSITPTYRTLGQKMPLSDWDQKVGPHLQMIEAGAAIVARNVAALAIRPNFETLAENEIHKAREALLEALDKIDCAQAAYMSKPVEA